MASALGIVHEKKRSEVNDMAYCKRIAYARLAVHGAFSHASPSSLSYLESFKPFEPRDLGLL